MYIWDIYLLGVLLGILYFIATGIRVSPPTLLFLGLWWFTTVPYDFGARSYRMLKVLLK